MINVFNGASILFIKRILFISIFAALLSISLINSPCVAQVPVKSSDWIDAELYPILLINKTDGGQEKDFGKSKYVLRKNGIVENGKPREYSEPGLVIVVDEKWTATETGILTIYQKIKQQSKHVMSITDGKMELKLQGLGECQGPFILNIDVSSSNSRDNKKIECDIRFRVVFAKKEPVNPNVVDNKLMSPKGEDQYPSKKEDPDCPSVNKLNSNNSLYGIPKSIKIVGPQNKEIEISVFVDASAFPDKSKNGRYCAEANYIVLNPNIPFPLDAVLEHEKTHVLLRSKGIIEHGEIPANRVAHDYSINRFKETGDNRYLGYANDQKHNAILETWLNAIFNGVEATVLWPFDQFSDP